MSPTRLDQLSLHNFRAFRDLTLDFHPKLTVLVARNGMGKTAVLDAIAIAWRAYVDTMLGSIASLGFAREDIRLARTPTGQMVDQLPVRLDARGQLRGVPVTWSRELAKRRGRTSRTGANPLVVEAQELLLAHMRYGDGRSAEPLELPLLAYYGTGRLWREGRLTTGKYRSAQDLRHSLDAYQDCLSPGSSYNAFSAWFERVCREVQRKGPEGAPMQAYIDAVRVATDRLLRPSGWSRLDWDFYANAIVASHADFGELPVAFLSDGVRNTLGLVADLAHRCVRLNPHHGAQSPLKTSGLVLIDEVDMHLHPGWQQDILSALRDAFPQIQFIVTTHSPQVLSTVPSACIRILDLTPEGSSARQPDRQTQGVPSPDVLSAVMEVNPAPNLPIRQDLDRYRALIQDGLHGSDKGLTLRAKLDAHFGPSHPEILDLDRLIRFQRVLRRKDAENPT